MLTFPFIIIIFSYTHISSPHIHSCIFLFICVFIYLYFQTSLNWFHLFYVHHHLHYPCFLHRIHTDAIFIFYEYSVLLLLDLCYIYTPFDSFYVPSLFLSSSLSLAVSWRFMFPLIRTLNCNILMWLYLFLM